MLKELSSVHKSATTYGIGGTVVIAFAGFWLVLFTSPTCSTRWRATGFPMVESEYPPTILTAALLRVLLLLVGVLVTLLFTSFD